MAKTGLSQESCLVKEGRNRRAFLGSLVVGAAGAAFASVGVSDADATPSGVPPGVTVPAGVPSDVQYMPLGNGAYELYQIVNGQKIIYARLARDGLLMGYVWGNYVAQSAGTFTLFVPLIADTVAISMAPDTVVLAGGEERIADLSLCNVGDELSVGTTLDASGGRVAEYVRANVMIGFVQISQVNPSGFTGAFVDKGLAPIPAAAPMQFTTDASTTLSPTPGPSVGEYWHVFATTSSPDNPTGVWVLNAARVGVAG